MEICRVAARFAAQASATVYCGFDERESTLCHKNEICELIHNVEINPAKLPDNKNPLGRRADLLDPRLALVQGPPPGAAATPRLIAGS
jgi:hypothetical protein